MNTPTTLTQERILATEIPGPRSQALQARKVAAVSAGIGTTLPVYVEQAGGGILRDVDGNQLIDFGSGIAVTTVGNAAPRVVEAVQRQVADFTHTCFMVTPYEEYVAVCEKLADLTPGDHEKRSALFNSGAEAVENAVKVARHHTGRDAIVVFDHAYHGRTNLTMALTAKNMPYKHRFGPVRRRGLPGADGLPLPLAGWRRGVRRRGVRRVRRRPCTRRWARTAAPPCSSSRSRARAASSCPPPGWLPRVADWCREQGILLIADEIQTGFARTGDWFACDHEGVVPDLVTTAKGMAGGLPLAAVTGRADVMDSVHVGGLGGTYGGNPVACAAALGRDRDHGGRGPARPGTGDRGRLPAAAPRPRRAPPRPGRRRPRTRRDAGGRAGQRRPGRTPDAALAGAVHRACSAQGLVTLTCGTFGNVFRFLPPLAIGDDLLAEGLDVFEAAFEEAVGGPGGRVG